MCERLCRCMCACAKEMGNDYDEWDGTGEDEVRPYQQAERNRERLEKEVARQVRAKTIQGYTRAVVLGEDIKVLVGLARVASDLDYLQAAARLSAEILREQVGPGGVVTAACLENAVAGLPEALESICDKIDAATDAINRFIEKE